MCLIFQAKLSLFQFETRQHVLFFSVQHQISKKKEEEDHNHIVTITSHSVISYINTVQMVTYSILSLFK